MTSNALSNMNICFSPYFHYFLPFFTHSTSICVVICHICWKLSLFHMKINRKTNNNSGNNNNQQRNIRINNKKIEQNIKYFINTHTCVSLHLTCSTWRRVIESAIVDVNFIIVDYFYDYYEYPYLCNWKISLSLCDVFFCEKLIRHESEWAKIWKCTHNIKTQWAIVFH